MPNLSTNAYIFELCASALHRGHAKYFKSLTCRQNRGHATLLEKKKQYVRVILAQKAMQFFSAQRKNVQPIPCRRENRHSCAGSPTICGRLFRDIRTFGRAVEGSSVSPLTNTMGGLSGGGRGATRQESVPLFHSSSLGFVPELWPWIWAVAPAVLPSSLGKHTPSKAPVPHDARAQPCEDCIVALGAPDALLPSHQC